MEQQKVHERRFRLTLYKMKIDGNNLSPEEEICELVCFRANFSLNTIPQATIYPALGTVINSDESKTAELKQILELAKSRTPMGVYVQVTHSFNLENQKEHQYWPENKQDTPDEFGQYIDDDKKICVFKGYLQPPSADISAYGAGISLTLDHWLVSLATMSMLTPFSHMSNPADASLQLYGMTDVSEVSWNTFAVKTPFEDIWKDGIKELFNKIIEQMKDKYSWNYFSEDCKKRIQLAIENIKSEDYLQLDNSLLLKDNESLLVTIGEVLRKDATHRQEYCNIGAWDKLVSHYGSDYLFSLVPRVSDALLIPTPCVVDKDTHIDIDSNEIFQLRAAPVSQERISRVICTHSTVATVKGDTSGIMGEYPTSKLLAKYKEDKNTIIDGSVKIIGYPSWLVQEGSVPVSAKPITLYQEVPASVRSDISSGSGEIDEAREIQNSLGQRYAKHVYLMSAFNSTWATITTPARMDICPGAMVHIDCNIDNQGNKLNLYGTVMALSIELMSGSRPSTSSINLINIRDDNSIESEIDNPKVAGYYKQQWTGMKEKENEVLYVTE